ncbi:hypothetical protein Nepgr_027256 [Nepenthes gracilis]|uniref:Secreted protein n=1 Tax=Nepenthes gracilis TaxID=150966 RepID=A0AAD3T8L2_NEPGR|nr:hypothetical protein Nepgr_027256 [Nepenthes gracilis]
MLMISRGLFALLLSVAEMQSAVDLLMHLDYSPVEPINGIADRSKGLMPLVSLDPEPRSFVVASKPAGNPMSLCSLPSTEPSSVAVPSALAEGPAYSNVIPDVV